MGVISWIIVGVVVALIMSQVSRVEGTSTRIVNIVVGVIGAVVGGFVTNLVMFFPPFDFSWASLFVAAMAALVFVAVLNFMRRPE
jgi:uncharacterized membrane protein YeaQ/YmgE (transglycosylase-associated protein family)